MTPTYHNYSQIFEALEHRESFHGNIATGIRVDFNSRDWKYGDNQWYSVYSYSTLILRYNLNTGEIEYWNSKYYSQTTSRLQSLIKRAFMPAFEDYTRAQNVLQTALDEAEYATHKEVTE